MIFNAHSARSGSHAFLSPSKASWTNYDDDKLERVYTQAMAAAKGVELHNLANDLIRLGVKLEDTGKTLNSYVNDAIGYRMNPEQMLFYSDNCFGTADAIGFRNNLLRIHDLKTGVTPASPRQLEVYAALFCLEYEFTPNEIDIEMRIYQNDHVETFETDPLVIFNIIDTIIRFDKRINEIRMEASL
jgi:hypothetical protein